jgi:hypothetical protein
MQWLFVEHWWLIKVIIPLMVTKFPGSWHFWYGLWLARHARHIVILCFLSNCQLNSFAYLHSRYKTCKYYYVSKVWQVIKYNLYHGVIVLHSYRNKEELNIVSLSRGMYVSWLPYGRSICTRSRRKILSNREFLSYLEGLCLSILPSLSWVLGISESLSWLHI